MLYLKNNIFFKVLKKTMVNLKKKKKKQWSIFFSKKPVFTINIRNLPQFVNHTVVLVQNKNNNERISLK